MRAHPYRIERIDRVVIQDVEYRLKKTVQIGWLFERIDRPDVQLTLTVAEFETEMLGEGFRLDPGALSEGREASRKQASARDLGEIPPSELAGVLKRLTWVDRCLALLEAGEASRSDVGMEAATLRIQADLDSERIQRNEEIWARHLEGLAARKERVDAPAPSGLDNVSVGRPCGRTLLRWVGRYIAGGRSAVALRQGFHRSGNHRRRPGPEVLQLLAEAAKGYMSLQRPTRATCFRDLRTAVRQLNMERAKAGLPKLRCPSRRLLDREIATFDRFEVYAARHGQERALRKYGPLGAGLDVTRAGERIEMDEWAIHAQTLLDDSDGSRTLDATWRAAAEAHRLFVCVAVDAASRLVLGASFSSAPNTTENALAALAMVATDKTPLARWAGAQAPWNQACTPESIATDAGSGFVSDDFKAAVSDLTSQRDVPASGVPQLRARVERLFRTFEQELMPLIPGRTFSNIADLGDYDAEARAALLDVTLKQVFLTFVVDVYNQKPHGGLKGATPADQWAHLEQTYGIVPCRGGEVRRNALGVELSRKVGRHGVRLLGLNYTSERLQERFRRTGTHEVAVRMDPLDLGRVSVRTPEGWLACPCVQRKMAGVSMDVWVAAEADLRARHKARAKLSEHTVLDAISRIKAIVTASEAQFGLGGARPTADDVNRLQAAVRISFPSSLGFEGEEPSALDPRVAAIPRGTPVEVYAVIEPDEGDDEADDEPAPFHEFADDQPGAGPSPGAGGEDGSSATPASAATPEGSPAEDEAAPAVQRDVSHQADEDPFYEFEDGDDE